MKSTLEQKTIRPGSLADYSFYYSNRRSKRSAAKKPKKHRLSFKFVALLVVLGAAALSFQLSQRSDQSPVASNNQGNASASTAAAQKPNTQTDAKLAAAPVNHCQGNTIPQLIKVSINQRRMWACAGETSMYDAPIISGMEKHPSTESPLGTYKIYAKNANTVLTGTDETGSWRDPVDYWMPFLDNQYGTYGFHDATWRAESEFGNIDANTSDNASHGCIEQPLAAAKWFYNWAQVGTSVTIES